VLFIQAIIQAKLTTDSGERDNHYSLYVDNTSSSGKIIHSVVFFNDVTSTKINF